MANIQKKLLLFLTILATTFLVACSPRVIEKVEYRNDTIFQTKYLRDSVYLHDSVYTFIHAVGDTIFIDRYKSVIRYRERIKTDTLRQTKEIVKTDTEIVEIKKKNSWFPTFIIGLLCGGLLLLVLQSRNSKMN